MHKPSHERLEPRRLLAAAVANDVLTITGTDGDDVISVTVDGPSFVVDINGEETSFGKLGLAGIRINAGDGNDNVSLGFGVNLDAVIHGGDGDDTLHGGGGARDVRGLASA